MIYGYARVSTKSQSYASQKKNLLEQGVLTKNIYCDKWTGATTNRPEFNKLLKKLNSNDILIVTKLDRLARNTREALNLIEPMLEKGITIKIINLGTIENTLMGRMVLRTLLSVYEMERDMILERSTEGKEYAKKHNLNYKEGRPKAVKTPKKEHAYNLLKTNSYSKVVEMTGYSKSSLQRIKKMYEK